MLLIAPSLPWAEHGRWACPPQFRPALRVSPGRAPSPLGGTYIARHLSARSRLSLAKKQHSHARIRLRVKGRWFAPDDLASLRRRPASKIVGSREAAKISLW